MDVRSTLLRFARAAGAGVVLLAALQGCSSAPPRDTRVLIFGEQHDQPDQQRQIADALRELAARRRLHALVIEMAERGHDTAALPASAEEDTVKRALGWDEAGWPWEPYRPIVMAAVRAGVPVAGGNLPRSALRETMADQRLDATLPAAARESIGAALREGHCGLLPAAQEPGMLRVQIARDRSMAETVLGALRDAPAGSLVVLHAGAQHASRDRGVPLHLSGLPANALKIVLFGSPAPGLQADEQRPAETTPREDPCRGLRERLAPPAPAG